MIWYFLHSAFTRMCARDVLGMAALCFALSFGVAAMSAVEEAAPPATVLEKSSLIGFDSQGTPLVCGSGPHSSSELLSVSSNEAMQEWEVFPSAVQKGAATPIYITVSLGRAVKAVEIRDLQGQFVGPDNLVFHDSGTQGDAIKSDNVFTCGPFYLVDGNMHFRPTLKVGTSNQVGRIVITELDDSETLSLIDPTVGVLAESVALDPVRSVSPGFQVTDVLANLSRSTDSAQAVLRNTDFEDRVSLTKELYKWVEDQYDFVVLMSSGKTERLPTSTTSSNYNAGVAWPIKSSGLHQSPFDDSLRYGSYGRLQGYCSLDYQSRGMYTANLVHEMLHRWGANLDHSLGLTSGGHYDPRSSVGSLIGGFKWNPNGDGSFEREPMIGRNGAYRASSADLFSMGLLGLDLMPDFYLAPSIDFASEKKTILASEITRTVTPIDIRAAHGARIPSTEGSQKAFRFLFVIGSKNRLLTEVELTYYGAFIKEATRILEANEPDPYVGQDWVPMTRFFGEGVTWSADVRLKRDDMDRDGDGHSDLRDMFPDDPSEWLDSDGDNTDSDADPDGDGYNSQMEQLLDLDPMDAKSAPRLSVFGTESGFVIDFAPYKEALRYQLESHQSAGNWILVPEIRREVDSESIRFSIPLDPPKLYRISITGLVGQ